MQRCPECGVYPMSESGSWRPVSVQRWWCDAHKHLAQEGDLSEYESPYTGLFTSGGAPIPTEKEKARLAEWARQREEKEERDRRAREAYEQREYEATEAARERFREEGEISILGVRCRPNGRVIR